MWSSQRWLVIEQPPIKFTGASKSEGRKLACTLSLSPCNSPVWWWWVCHFFRGKKWSKGNTVFWSGNNLSQMPVLKQKTGASSNSCLLTDYTQLWVFWKRVVLSRNLPRDGCLALWAPSGNGKSKTPWFRVCLPWCGIGWLQNVAHIELNALGTISLNLRHVESSSTCLCHSHFQ